MVDDVLFVNGGSTTEFSALDARTGHVLFRAWIGAEGYAPLAFADGAVIVANSSGSLHTFARSIASVRSCTLTRGGKSIAFAVLSD